jgi:hypothetical protein
VGRTLDFKKGHIVLHPNQFKVNETWIAFKLNDEPICTEIDGDFNFIALMDAASCFILSFAQISTKFAELSQIDSNRLMDEAKAHKMRLPKTLFVPLELHANFLVAEAEQCGIEVVRVNERQLHLFIGEARAGFRKRFRGAHRV